MPKAPSQGWYQWEKQLWEPLVTCPSVTKHDRRAETAPEGSDRAQVTETCSTPYIKMRLALSRKGIPGRIRVGKKLV